MPNAKSHKKEPEPSPETPVQPLGISPSSLAKRNVKQKYWCPAQNIEFDPACDPENPKTVTHRDINKALNTIRDEIPKTPVRKSRCCDKFKMELYYKLENVHRIGSFYARGALYALSMLTTEQKFAGVITASLGNWAIALSYYGHKLDVTVTVVMPADTAVAIVDKCTEYRAIVVLHGENLGDAKMEAFGMVAENKCLYINGYDHPNVIAGNGTIGMEIFEQVPDVDVVLVPVGGGGLLAGIAVALNHLKPDIEIYGIQSDRCCSFFKAMEQEKPYKTAVSRTIASSLAVPTAGVNAFHTARSFVSKMALVDDDWITRAVLHLIEEEKMVVEGAGAAALSPMLSIPSVLPELEGKTVVCIVSGGNIDTVTLPRCLERAKAVEGRLINLTVTVNADDMQAQLHVLSMVANLGCNVVNCYADHTWLVENDLSSIELNLMVETRDLEHACTLKRAMNKLFPYQCDFVEEPYSPLPICVCFPKKKVM